MAVPEYITTADGWKFLTLPAPFGDERKKVVIHYHEEITQLMYMIYVDGKSQGVLMHNSCWQLVPASRCKLTDPNIALLAEIIEESEIWDGIYR